MVTARQRILIRASWELMRPTAVHVADLFYDRLFELDPSLEGLFPEELAAQRPRFMNAVGAAVAGLDDIESLRPALQDIGRQNLSHGVQPDHYDTLGQALLWTFEQSLAEQFTPAMKDAWAALHAELSRAMVQVGAREGQPARGRLQLAL